MGLLLVASHAWCQRGTVNLATALRNDLVAARASSTSTDSATVNKEAVVEKLQNKQLSQLAFETFAKYIQLAYDRDLLTQKATPDGAGATYVLKGTLFAIDGLTRGDFDELSTRQGTAFMRHFSVELGAKTGKGSSVSDGVFGFNWAIVNKRDPFFNFPANEIELQSKAVVSLSAARVKFKAKLLATPDPALAAKEKAAVQKDKAAGNTDEQLKFYQSQGYAVSAYTLALVAEALKTRGLLTLFGRANTNFGKTQGFTHGELGLRYLVGWLPVRNSNSLELDARTAFAWDTTATPTAEPRGLDHRAFITTVGLNKVLISSSDVARPLLEFKLNAGYEHRPSQLYNGESRDKLYGETSLRVRINEQVWVPLTVQYDTHGNVLGFLKVVWNIVPN
ncbi:hypothetical protein [Hymenobacter terricola]|uniref:hypothetical protein n=1 Tax=Hymenobacter terricola TaxID=2819236 RepID=UPI001B305600|nr:hypothetical protein [Hymenobacter terricola]